MENNNVHFYHEYGIERDISSKECLFLVLSAINIELVYVYYDKYACIWKYVNKLLSFIYLLRKSC